VTVYVGNIPFNALEPELAFALGDKVLHVKMPRDRGNRRRNKGYAFVKVTSIVEAGQLVRGCFRLRDRVLLVKFMADEQRDTSGGSRQGLAGGQVGAPAQGG
jgi:hypothetical protein